MEGSPYQKFSISRRKGSDPETEPGKRHSGEPGFLLVGILGTGVPSNRDPEAGVLPRVPRNSIPEYFSPTGHHSNNPAIPGSTQARTAFEAMSEPGGVDPEIIVWNPEEPRGSSLDPEIFDWNPEAIGEPGETQSSLGTRNVFFFARTVLHLPRQGYYRKSLTGLEVDGVGVMTQVPGLRCFPRLEKQDLDWYFSHWYSGTPMRLRLHRVLGSFDSILMLAHTHSCFRSHTTVVVPHW
ncbi:hypothetical protein F2Q70_00002837 [Brassica cretica]|uniref:Uncharacterized protein n=1 Tax=Brassica cretica TaxID=69181 RepID=A0A8S9IST9_BRACR|nr:hypothetical protein F2Q70_00002837 [Brassica cretica]